MWKLKYVLSNALHMSSHFIIIVVHVARSLVVCEVVCTTLLFLLSLFIWSLCCIYVFDLRLLITPCSSLNFSCYCFNFVCLIWYFFYLLSTDNLVSNKIATQHPSPGLLHAELSIDGDKTSGSCSRTSGAQAWWQVDLGDISTITAIYITYQHTGKI
jgi:hypothetical protein